MKKKLVILGAGESGVGAALLAKQKGYDVFVSNDAGIKELWKNELISNDIVYEEGGHDEDVILKAKGLAKEKGTSYKKTDADGLAGRFKIFGQIMLGIIIGATLYFNDSVVVKREIFSKGSGKQWNPQRGEKKIREDSVTTNGIVHYFASVKTPITTIPFVKNHEFNYARLLPKSMEQFTYIIYILIVIFIVTAVSNGANITDGLDGLATGVSAIIGLCLGVFVFVSDNVRIADYLNIMYIHNAA